MSWFFYSFYMFNFKKDLKNKNLVKKLKKDRVIYLTQKIAIQQKKLKLNIHKKKLFHFIFILFCYLIRKHQKYIFKKFNFFTKGKIRKGMEWMVENDL